MGAQTDVKDEAKDGQPSEPVRRRDFVVRDIDTSAKERAHTFVISTDDIARDEGVLLSRGMSLKNYSANPVLLWSHSRLDPAIGSAMWTRKDLKSEPNRIIAKYRYANNADGEKFYTLVEDGIIRAVSVSWNPMDFSAPTPDEIRANPDWADARWVCRESDLEEVSLCNVPALTQALKIEAEHCVIDGVKRGKITREFARSFMGVEVPDDAPPPEPPAREELGEITTEKPERENAAVASEPEPTPEPEPERETPPPVVVTVRMARPEELTRTERLAIADRVAGRILEEELTERMAIAVSRRTGKPIR